MKKARVTFQCEHGAISEQGARKHFSKTGVTLPVKTFWESMFYHGFQGTIHHAMCKNTLIHLRESAAYVKILDCCTVGKTIIRRSS